MFPFYTPWKRQKTEINIRFSDVFRGYRKGPLTWNGLTTRLDGRRWDLPEPPKSN